MRSKRKQPESDDQLYAELYRIVLDYVFFCKAVICSNRQHKVVLSCSMYCDRRLGCISYTLRCSIINPHSTNVALLSTDNPLFLCASSVLPGQHDSQSIKYGSVIADSPQSTRNPRINSNSRLERLKCQASRT